MTDEALRRAGRSAIMGGLHDEAHVIASRLRSGTIGCRDHLLCDAPSEWPCPACAGLAQRRLVQLAAFTGSEAARLVIGATPLLPITPDEFTARIITLSGFGGHVCVRAVVAATEAAIALLGPWCFFCGVQLAKHPRVVPLPELGPLRAMPLGGSPYCTLPQRDDHPMECLVSAQAYVARPCRATCDGSWSSLRRFQAQDSSSWSWWMFCAAAAGTTASGESRRLRALTGINGAVTALGGDANRSAMVVIWNAIARDLSAWALGR